MCDEIEPSKIPRADDVRHGFHSPPPMTLTVAYCNYCEEYFREWQNDEYRAEGRHHYDGCSKCLRPPMTVEPT